MSETSPDSAASDEHRNENARPQAPGSRTPPCPQDEAGPTNEGHGAEASAETGNEPEDASIPDRLPERPEVLETPEAFETSAEPERSAGPETSAEPEQPAWPEPSAGSATAPGGSGPSSDTGIRPGEDVGGIHPGEDTPSVEETLERAEPRWEELAGDAAGLAAVEELLAAPDRLARTGLWGKVEVIALLERAANRVGALQSRVIADLAQDPALWDHTGRCFVSEELSARLGLSRYEADHRLAESLALTTCHSQALEAMDAGVLDRRKIRSLLEEAALLPTDLAVAVAAQVLGRPDGAAGQEDGREEEGPDESAEPQDSAVPGASEAPQASEDPQDSEGPQTSEDLQTSQASEEPQASEVSQDSDPGWEVDVDRVQAMTPTEMREAVRAAAIAVDPTAAAQRHERERRRRTVIMETEREGMARVTAYLPAEAAMTVWTALAGMSGRQGADDERALSQRRADAFTTTFADVLERGEGPLGPLMRRRGRRGALAVLIDAPTLLGLASNPAYLAGYGPVTAEIARIVAEDATWQRMLADPTGHVVGVDVRKWRAGRVGAGPGGDGVDPTDPFGPDPEDPDGPEPGIGPPGGRPSPDDLDPDGDLGSPPPQDDLPPWDRPGRAGEPDDQERKRPEKVGECRPDDPGEYRPDDPREYGLEDPREYGLEDPREYRPDDPGERGPEDPGERGPEDPGERGPEVGVLLDPKMLGPEDQDGDGPEDPESPRPESALRSISLDEVLPGPAEVGSGLLGGGGAGPVEFLPRAATSTAEARSRAAPSETEGGPGADARGDPGWIGVPYAPERGGPTRPGETLGVGRMEVGRAVEHPDGIGGPAAAPSGGSFGKTTASVAPRGPAFDVGHQTSAADVGYRPPAWLVALIEARDMRCAFPGCRMQAVHCDLDHIVPFDVTRPAGTQTVPANLAPLCRRHHEAKTTRVWSYGRDATTGLYTWTSPTGHVYTTAADPVRPLPLSLRPDRNRLDPAA